jgi:aryl-alcohol dehydrogenase-like predicted oxidoreductase
MQSTELGATGLTISRIGFGAWAAGGADWRFGWSMQEDDDSLAAILRALELGVDWIDTAPAYGFGHSEAIVGRAIEGISERPRLFTKCGALEAPGGGVRFCLDRDSILAEIERSLTRLGVEAIDLYQIHRPLPDADIEEGWSTLVELRDAGLARHIGVSNFTVAQLERVAAIAPVETLQPPYSLMQPESAAGLLPFAKAAGIGVLCYSPMGSGLLTGTMTRERFDALPPGDWRRSDERFSAANLERSFELVPRLRRVGARHGASPGEVAVAWALRNPSVDVAIVGFRKPRQVDAILAASSLELSDEDIAEIEGTAAPRSPDARRASEAER